MVTATAGAGRWRRALARARRIGGIVVVALVLLVVVLAAALALAPVRGVLLGWGLAAADRSLPGTFEVGRASWPRLGTIDLRDVRWLGPSDEAPADTLLHLRRLLVVVDTGELSRRDLAVDSLLVDVVDVDVPAVQAILPAGAAAAAADSSGAAGGWDASLPRAGSLPGLPSAAVRRLAVVLDRARLAPDLTARDLRLVGGVDLRADQTPGGSVLLTGGGLARTGGAPLQVALDTLALQAHWDEVWGGVVADSLLLVVPVAGPPALTERWAGREPLRVGGHGRVRMRGADGDGAASLRITSPGLPLLGPARPAALDTTILSRVVVLLQVEGGRTGGAVTARARADLAGTPGLDRARLALRAAFPDSAPTAGRVDVDSLVLALPGLDLSASGSHAAGRLHARIDAAVRTPVPLLERLTPAAAAVAGGVAGTVTVDGTAADPRLGIALHGDARTAGYAVPWFTLAMQGDRRDVTVNLAAGGGLAERDSVGVDSLRVRLRARPASAGDLLDAARLRLDVTCRARGRGNLGRLGLVASAVVPRAAPLDGVVDVDTLALDWPGLAVHGSGRVDTARVDGALTAAVSSPCPVLEVLVPAIAAGEFTADLVLNARGSYRDPQVDVTATGSCDLPQATVPRLAFSARGERRAFTARLRAGGGLVVQGAVLADSLVLNGGFDQASGDSLPLRVGLAIWRSRVSLGLAAAAGTDSAATTATVRLDSLGLDLAGGTLRLVRPATVRVDTAARRIDVAGLDLAGSAGTVALEGSLAPDRARLAATVALDLSEAMLQAAAPTEIWSRDGGMDLSASGRLDLATGADSTRLGGGLDVRLHPHRDDPQLGVSLDFALDRGDTAGLGARFAVTAADTVLLHGAAVLPGRYDAGGRRWLPAADSRLLVRVPEQVVPTGLLRRVLPAGTSLRGDVTVAAAAALPVPALGDTADGGRIEGTVRTADLRVGLPNNSRVELRADCRLSGSPAEPKLSGTVTVLSGFVRIPELPRSLLPAKGTPALWSVTARGRLPAPGGRCRRRQRAHRLGARRCHRGACGAPAGPGPEGEGPGQLHGPRLRAGRGAGRRGPRRPGPGR